MEGSEYITSVSPPTITTSTEDKACIKLQVEHMNWSGRRDSNSRHSRWQRDALPLSYARLI